MRLKIDRRASAVLTAGAMVIGGGFAVAAPAYAAGTDSGACATAYSSTAVYTGGKTASENGVNYKAKWWTQGQDPASSVGNGGPWAALGSCTGDGGGTGTPPGNGGSTGGDCAVSWVSSVAYNGGATVSEGGVNYYANWWTSGDDPATHHGSNGQPWTSQGTCAPGDSGGTSTPTPPPGDGGGTPTPPPGDGGSTGGPSGILFSPYKDITVNMDWNTSTLRTAASGKTLPLVGSNSFYSSVEPKMGAITLAFATGTCDNETWAGVTPKLFIDSNIHALDAAGLNYVVSTGGAAGTFKCATGAGLESFIARYATPHMVGIDFDMEGGQTPADAANLVNAAAQAQSKYPNLRFSFTLATWAASDGSHAGLNSLGDSVIQAIKASSLKNYTIDLMVMDYGPASSSACVVVSGKCEMGQSAIQAAKNLEYTYGIPANKIELTPMIGPNDVAGENFTLGDVDTVTSYVVKNGLAGLHYWSLEVGS